ncbi:MAG: DNA repair protein RecO [Pseudomonadota bacterium]
MNAPSRETEGIVLRIIDYGESDRIVGFLTPDMGKISAFAMKARVSRKRFGGTLDLFHCLAIDLRPPRDPQGALWRLERVSLVEGYHGLRGDLRRLAAAGYLADCLWNLLGEGDPHPETYAWWKEALGRLATQPISVAADLRFELELLSFLGFAPHWDRCLECGSESVTGQVFFSFVRGGVICSRCPRSGEGRFVEAAWIKAAQAGDPLPPPAATQLRQVLNSFVCATLGREPKSQKFREEVFRGEG